MKVSVIISACDNRKDFFKRALNTWERQTSKDFEIVIVDDGARNYEEICRQYDLNFQIIQIDKARNLIKPKTFIPVLTNNVGIKMARGEVIVITGPETLQNANNIEVSASMANRRECAYGLVYKADKPSTEYISKNWTSFKDRKFEDLLYIKGVQAECLTRPPHPPAYLYYMAVAKQYALEIGGFDERFLKGLCAEDDDFAQRMAFFNVKPVFEHKIIGIHQNHSTNDNNDNIHLSRYSEEGMALWEHNKNLYKQNKENKLITANAGIEWGSSYLITNHIILGDI